MKICELDEKQKTAYSKIDRKIKRIKSKARRNNKNEPHIQIKSATDELRKLYYSDEVRLDQRYLLRRYVQLERTDIVWINIWFPIFCTILSVESMYTLFEPLLKDVFSIVGEIKSIQYFTMGESIKVLFGLAIMAISFLLLIYSVLVLYKLLFASLTRNADTTIKENELKIITSILHHQGVLVDENKEYEEGMRYFVKDKTNKRR